MIKQPKQCRSDSKKVWLFASLVLCTWVGCNRSQPDRTSQALPPATRPSVRQSAEAAAHPTISGHAFKSDDGQLKASHEEWPTEYFAEKAAAILKKWTKAQSNLDAAAAAPTELFSEDAKLAHFANEPSQVYARSSLRVLRSKPTDGGEVLVTGREGSVTAFIKTLGIRRNQSADDIHIKTKIVRVALSGQRATSALRVEASCKTSNASVQTTTEWDCKWRLDGAAPQIEAITLKSYEAVESSSPPWFVDATAAVVGNTEAFREQLAHGLQHWLSRIETAHGQNYFSKHGLAIADINGDGRDDVYVCQPGGLPNRLFIQQADGTAREKSKEYGLDYLDRTASAVFVDLDNDGDQDAALATMMGVLIFENKSNTTFELKQNVTLPDIDLHGITAVDFDNDGDLDLYQIIDFASNDSRARQGLPQFVYHNARDGGANRLLRNDLDAAKRGQSGAFRFTDVTASVGLDVNNRRHSLASAWEDYDNDGDQDLYVANDYGPNSLYQNTDGRFVDVAESVGALDFGSGMSVTWGDYDRDGQTDLYVGNMFSSAGNRLTTQPQFLSHVKPENRGIYQRFAKGNTLLRNAGESFEDQTNRAQVGMGRWSWSSLFADVDNDGWQDLLVSNGYITTEDNGDL